MNDAQIKHMVDRFLAWPLPADFNPDAGISFEPSYAGEGGRRYPHNPSGTNLLDAKQAEAMIKHLAEGMPAETTYDDHKEALADLVHLMSEQDASGGGPGFSERWEKAKRRAFELFEP